MYVTCIRIVCSMYVCMYVCRPMYVYACIYACIHYVLASKCMHVHNTVIRTHIHPEATVNKAGWPSCIRPISPHTVIRDRLKNTLKPMKWNIFHFSLDPLPPSRKWNSVLLLASFYDGKHKHEANFFWKSEIVTMKSLPPPPLVKNISLHWLQGIFETVP